MFLEWVLRHISTLNHHVLLRLGRLALIRTHKLSVHCKDCHLHSRGSTQLAERTPDPSPSCLSR